MCLGIITNIHNLRILDLEILQKPRITLWSVSHFMTFFIIGKLCPNNYLLFFILGILWESFEKIYGIITNEQVYWTGGGSLGQATDIVMNMLGYHLAHQHINVKNRDKNRTFVFLVGVSFIIFAGLHLIL